MSSLLQDKLDLILSEKQNVILPENIKKDVEILGITGTYEGSGGATMNLFVQSTEPLTYNGIWIQSNTFTYNNIVEVTDENNLIASSINIVKGDDYETILFDNEDGLNYRFNKIYLTDTNSGIVYNINVFYGNGSQWIDITPKQYTELEYIQSTGTQYIETLVGANATNLKIEAKFFYPTNASDGFLWSSYSNGYGLGDLYNDSKYHAFSYFYSNNTASTISAPSYATNTLYVIESTQNLTKIDTVLNNNSSSINRNVTAKNTNIVLLRQGNNAQYYAILRLYYLKIYIDNNLVRDFIPIKDFNDVVCLYDKVSQDYFYNAGTGTFIAGPEV